MTQKEASAWSPFRHSVFAVLWTATVVSNIGTWMHDVAAGWLMASLTSQPLFVASVQAATTLPVFLFALPAGALADILDRRKLLLVVKVALTVIAACLGVMVFMEAVNPLILIIFTFAMGTGAAFIAPTWQAIVPQLVPKEDLQSAVALHSVGINISRAIGPALGGAIIVGLGVGMPFIFNAISFLGVVGALLWWKPEQTDTVHLPAERFAGAIRTGMRFARESQPLRSTLIRAAGFFLFASAYWALLPLIARDLLAGGAAFYGILLAAIGVGALIGAVALPKLKALLGPNKLVAVGCLTTALVLVIFSTVDNQYVAVVTSLLAGASWLAVLSNLNVSAQTALPEWVRARGLSVLLIIYFGSMAGGSLLWGRVADGIGIPQTLLIAAAGAVIAVPLTWRWKLHLGAKLDLTPSMHWTPNIFDLDVEEDRGPVMVTIEYLIDPNLAPEFLDLIRKLGENRRRDNSFSWGVFEDAERPGRYLEYFMVESWLEHSRQHHRVTEADKNLEELVRNYHLGKEPVKVGHFVAPSRDAMKKK